jgi:hypothetical protein
MVNFTQNKFIADFIAALYEKPILTLIKKVLLMKRHFMLTHDLHNRVRSVMFISLAFLLGVLYPSPGYSQKKVKVFLMAGQSNMQGHASITQLDKILCAKNTLDLPGDSKGCYDSITDQEERLFQTISDFYWTGSGYGYGYEEGQARLEAQSIDTNELVDGHLLSPFDRVQVVNFKVNRSNGEIGNPAVWYGPLQDLVPARMSMVRN